MTGPRYCDPRLLGTGCTDMGDVSAIMPAIHPHASGSIGTGHGKDYYVANKKAGCLYPAQCLTVAASMFLENDAARAKKSPPRRSLTLSPKRSIWLPLTI